MKKTLEFLNHGIFPGLTLFTCGMNQSEILKELRSKKMNAKHAAPWIRLIEEEKALIEQPESFGWAGKRIMEKVRTKESRTLFVISIKRFDRSDFAYVALAHEVLHIVNFFLKDVLDRDREYEAEAYLHSHLMSQCLKSLK